MGTALERVPRSQLAPSAHPRRCQNRGIGFGHAFKLQDQGRAPLAWLGALEVRPALLGPHVALIARHGADWWREVGTGEAPGSYDYLTAGSQPGLRWSWGLPARMATTSPRRQSVTWQQLARYWW